MVPTYQRKKGGLRGRMKCRAGQATKIMAVADSAGLPVAVTIADGSRHDVSLVDQTLDQAVTDLHTLPSKLIGDKAFDSAELAERLRDERYIELIAPKRKRNFLSIVVYRMVGLYVATNAVGKWSDCSAGSN
jgi:hypothetical protein